MLGIRWGADNAVIDAITELARKHDLIVYDPQGPDVHLPDEPIDDTPISPPSATDILKFVPMAFIAAGIFLLGWWIDVPVINWILMIVGGFFFTVVLFLLGILIFARKD